MLSTALSEKRLESQVKLLKLVHTSPASSVRITTALLHLGRASGKNTKFLIQAHVWEVGRITSESNWELRNFRCHGEQRKRKELPETEQGCGQIKLLSRVSLCWPRQEGLDRSHEGLLLLPLLLRLVISILSDLSLPYWFKLDLWDK